MQTIKQEKFFTVADIADRLGVAPSVIRRYSDEGRINHIRHPLNNYRLFKQVEAERFIKWAENQLASAIEGEPEQTSTQSL